MLARWSAPREDTETGLPTPPPPEYEEPPDLPGLDEALQPDD